MPASTSNPKEHPAWMDKLFPVVFCVAGLALIGFGSQGLLDGYSSKGWPTAEGVVTESRMARTGSGTRGYKPVVVYSYSVGGDGFSSDRILFGIASFSTISKSGRQRAAELLDKYPEDTPVTLAYDPKDPAKSTLNSGAHYTAWIAPVMGLPFLAAGLCLARQNKKKQSRR